MSSWQRTIQIGMFQSTKCSNRQAFRSRKIEIINTDKHSDDERFTLRNIQSTKILTLKDPNTKNHSNLRIRKESDLYKSESIIICRKKDLF